MLPQWLHTLSLCYLGLGLVCAVVVAVHLWRHPQKMWIMDIVWPVTALFGTVAVMWLYFDDYAKREAGEESPMPAVVAHAALHCGSGCTLGDIVAEWLAFFFPAVAVWYGWHTLFSDKLFAVCLSFGLSCNWRCLWGLQRATPSIGTSCALA